MPRRKGEPRHFDKTKAIPRKPIETRILRKCLGPCSLPFMSHGIHNRICVKCSHRIYPAD